jgi:hypothetical protein
MGWLVWLMLFQSGSQALVDTFEFGGVVTC